jgi:hypothetical protein
VFYHKHLRIHHVDGIEASEDRSRSHPNQTGHRESSCCALTKGANYRQKVVTPTLATKNALELELTLAAREPMTSMAATSPVAPRRLLLLLHGARIYDPLVREAIHGLKEDGHEVRQCGRDESFGQLGVVDCQCWPASRSAVQGAAAAPSGASRPPVGCMMQAAERPQAAQAYTSFGNILALFSPPPTRSCPPHALTERRPRMQPSRPPQPPPGHRACHLGLW